MKPKSIQEYENRVIKEAKSRLERNADGSFDEDELVREVASIIKFDANAARLDKAQRLVDNSKRPGGTPAKGQLLLPGLNAAYIYEPNRLVSDDDGHIIENYRALPAYKSADTKRAEGNVQRVFEQYRRKAEESRVFDAWALAQALDGRPALDLTWGNCIAENNYRLDDPVAA